MLTGCYRKIDGKAKGRDGTGIAHHSAVRTPSLLGLRTNSPSSPTGMGALNGDYTQSIRTPSAVYTDETRINHRSGAP